MKSAISQILQRLCSRSNKDNLEEQMRVLQARNALLEQTARERGAETDELRKQVANYASLVKELQGTDELTDLPNADAFRTHFSHTVKRAIRLGYSLSLMLINIDRLNEIYMRYGNILGDKVLAEVASILRNSVREIDFPGRWSDHELAAILHETDGDEASVVAERVRRRVSMLEVIDPQTGRMIKVTASIAISSLPKHGSTPESLLEYAQDAILDVQENGSRNIVIVAGGI